MNDAIDPVLARIAALAPAHRELDALILFGSRARGEAHAQSDWDFGYLATPGLDVLDLSAALVSSLGTDRVDLADLERAGAVLRFRAARDGVLAYERRPGAFDAFRLRAADFWCDAGPVIMAAQRAFLDGLRG